MSYDFGEGKRCPGLRVLPPTLASFLVDEEQQAVPGPRRAQIATAQLLNQGLHELGQGPALGNFDLYPQTCIRRFSPQPDIWLLLLGYVGLSFNGVAPALHNPQSISDPSLYRVLVGQGFDGLALREIIMEQRVLYVLQTSHGSELEFDRCCRGVFAALFECHCLAGSPSGAFGVAERPLKRELPQTMWLNGKVGVFGQTQQGVERRTAGSFDELLERTAPRALGLISSVR